MNTKQQQALQALTDSKLLDGRKEVTRLDTTDLENGKVYFRLETNDKVSPSRLSRCSMGIIGKRGGITITHED